ncbi:hypothetical protein [Brumimicrobium aurantiacum]|nr:hypothetical protein [Brumimicrobium aurantiacum]
MKLSIYIFYFAMIAIVFFSCKKEKLNSGSCGEAEVEWVDTLKCEEYASDSMTIISHGWGRYQYRTPYFNPNNSNEFIYSFYDYENNIQQLIKYNILTKQKLVLANLGIYNQPKWNENGWIAFSNMHHVHVVKEDGSDYRQVSTSTQNTFPFWVGDDLYWDHSPSSSSGFELRQNINQLINDTVGFSTTIFTADVINNKILTVTNIESSANPSTYYGIYDLDILHFFSRDSFNVITEFSKSLTGLAWHPSGEYFYSTTGYQGNNGNGGLYKITLSGHEEKIMDFCQSKQYSNISCSADGKYLIGERTAAKLVEMESWPGAGKIVQNSTIWLINTETLEETKINLE